VPWPFCTRYWRCCRCGHEGTCCAHQRPCQQCQEGERTECWAWLRGACCAAQAAGACRPRLGCQRRFPLAPTGCPLSCALQELASGATLAAVKELLAAILPGWLAECARLLGKPVEREASGRRAAQPAGWAVCLGVGRVAGAEQAGDMTAAAASALPAA
jgi:hypothetical protein